MKAKFIIRLGFLAFLALLVCGAYAAELSIQCGPASLLAVCKLLDVHADLDELCKLSNWDERRGTTMCDLYQAARKKGLYAVGVRLNLEELCRIANPAIVHVRGNHFLTVAGFLGNKLCLIDPPKPPYLMLQEAFLKIWDGNALLISKEKEDIPIRDEPGSVPEAEEPRIEFEETLYDFGRASWGQQVLHIFRFRNAGEKPLTISDVRSSCGCTSALLSEKNIPPGAEGEIEVVFNVGRRRGRTAEKVLVRSNDPDQPVVTLTVTGIVEGSLVVLPERLYFGDIHNTESIERTIELVDIEGGDVRIAKVESSSRYITAEIPPSSARVRDKVEIVVTIGPGLPIGRLNEKLVIHTDNKEQSSIEVPIEGNVVGEIKVFPNQFFFGYVERGEPVSRKVVISKTGDEDLKILKVESNLESVSVRVLSLEQNNKYAIKATLGSHAPEGTMHGIIKVHTNSVQQPVIELPLYALIKQ